MRFDSESCAVPAEELERIMAQYGSSLRRMCYVYLRDASMAEDAVQDTFMKAYGRMDTLRNATNEQAWLMRIAINTCKDYLRSGWFRYVNRKITPDTIAKGSCDPVMIDRTVLQEVMNLPIKYKEAVLLRYYQDMKPGQISEVLGISVAAVKMRIKRANQKLHQRLERWYFDE